MRRKRLGWIGLCLVASLVIAACTAGDDDTSDEGSDATNAPATGPSPGVTDDTVQVGVAYVDTESLTAVGLNYDLGEHEAVYQALFDEINEGGGINGRQLEPVFAPIDPTQTAPAEEACVKLTEDDDVFIVIGFFLADAVACPVATHATAVVGGNMTEDLVAQAQAPWVSPLPDSDQPEAVVQLFAEGGQLDGNVAVYTHQRDESTLNDVVLPALQDAGIEPVETGVATAPPEDQAALQAEIQTIAERFESSDVDTVLLVGASAQDWPENMADDDSYRPTLLFMDTIAVTAFATNEATTDTSILDGALAGGIYGTNQDRYEEAAMQECIQTLSDAGLETPQPDDVGDDPSNQPFQAAFQACPDMVLLRALLEEAGEDLNYGTLEQAIDGLEVTIPGDPTARTYGPPPAADGNPGAYLFEWNDESQTLQLAEG